MNQKIKTRVASWKKIFTAGRSDLNESSSWKDIFLTLDLSQKDNIHLFAQCVKLCGTFTSEEKETLNTLPYYTEVISLLGELPNSDFGNFFGSELPDGDMICFLRYPKLEEPQNGIILVEATVVTSNKSSYDLDLYTFFSGYMKTKNVIINYSKDVPEEWLDEKAIWEASLQEQDNTEESTIERILSSSEQNAPPF